MEDMEVLETEETTEALTEQQTEQETEQETTTAPEQETEMETEPAQTSWISNMPSLAENGIHEMYLALGVDLDYVPTNPGECFAMGTQAVCALFFIWLVFRTLFQFVRELGKGM